MGRKVEKAKQKANSPLLATLMMGGFVWLAIASQEFVANKGASGNSPAPIQREQARPQKLGKNQVRKYEPSMAMRTLYPEKRYADNSRVDMRRYQAVVDSASQTKNVWK